MSHIFTYLCRTNYSLSISFSSLLYKLIHMTSTILWAPFCHWRGYQSFFWDSHTLSSKVLLMGSLERNDLLERTLRNCMLFFFSKFLCWSLFFPLTVVIVFKYKFEYTFYQDEWSYNHSTHCISLHYWSWQLILRPI